MLCVCTTGFALYQGNPNTPDSIEGGLFFCKDNFLEVRAGYEGDYTFDRDLKIENGPEENTDRYKGMLQQATLVFNILNQFEIYGLGGGMRSYLALRPSFDHKKREIHSNFDWVWGGGARFIAFTWGNYTLGFDGKYQAANLSIKKLEVAHDHFSGGATWKVERWQAGGAISYKCGWLVPYIGGRYAEVKDRLRSLPKRFWPHRKVDLVHRRPWGATAGCGFYPGNYYCLNLEARFVDEQALSISLDFKF